MTTPESREPVREKRQASPSSCGTWNYIVPQLRLQVIFFAGRVTKKRGLFDPLETGVCDLRGGHSLEYLKYYWPLNDKRG